MPLKIFSCNSNSGPVSPLSTSRTPRNMYRRTSVVVTHFIRGKQHTAVYLVIAGNTGQECLQCHRGAVVTPCRLRPLGKHVFFTWDLPRSNTFSRVSKLFESSLGRLTVKHLLWKRGSLFVKVFIVWLIKKLYVKISRSFAAIMIWFNNYNFLSLI